MDAGRKVEGMLAPLSGSVRKRDEGRVTGCRIDSVAPWMIDEPVLEEEQEKDNGQYRGDDDAEHAR